MNARRRAAFLFKEVRAVHSDVLPAIQKSYDVNRWLLPRIERFSRRYKFTLGDRLQATALDLCLAIVEASHAKRKDRALFRADRLLDQLRILLRLAGDVGELSNRQVRYVSGLNEELGRMIGGWLRANRPEVGLRAGVEELAAE